MLKRFSRTWEADTGGVAGIREQGKYRHNPHEDYEWFQKYLSHWKHIQEETAEGIGQHNLLNHAGVYGPSIARVWRNRSLFVTDTGLIGLCSQSCRPGDVVCIFLLAIHTYVVRKVPERSSFKLISCAYVDGVMYGEVVHGRDIAQEETSIID
jgi:hypothetical protein